MSLEYIQMQPDPRAAYFLWSYRQMRLVLAADAQARRAHEAMTSGPDIPEAVLDAAIGQHKEAIAKHEKLLRDAKEYVSAPEDAEQHAGLVWMLENMLEDHKWMDKAAALREMQRALEYAKSYAKVKKILEDYVENFDGAARQSPAGSKMNAFRALLALEGVL